MNKITVITGSPRVKGNTNTMVEAFANAAQAAGATVARFDAAKLNMAGCRACMACYKTGHACAFEHGFDPIAESVLASDVVVFAIPLYWFSIPGQIKSVIDHLFAPFAGGKTELRNKTCLVLGTMGQPLETGLYEGVTVAMKNCCKFLNWEYNELVYGGMNEPGAIRNTDAIAKVEELARKYARA